MVEKIIINPEEIRGYGNIIIPHVTSDYDVVNASLESGTDTVNGQSMTVYELEYAPNLTNTVLSLSVSPSSVYVYDNVVFTAVLEDEDDNPISGATVTFKEGDTVLGTDTTDNTGEASLTLSTLTAGSHSVTANYSGDSTYASSTSSSVSVTVSHSYSLSFSSSSYVATGGSATLECTLLDNNVPVEGATISVSGSDSSLYSGITNNNGVASVTVSVSAETTFTATYSNATATCIVTVQALTLSLSANKNVLSYFDSETATLTAVYSGGSGATIELYNAATSVKIGNFTDAGNGNYTYSYSSAGTGDISLMAKIGTLESSSVSIEDCILYKPNEISRTSTYTTDHLTAVFSNFSFVSDSFLFEADVKYTGESIGICVEPNDKTSPYHHILWAYSNSKQSFYIGRQSSGEDTYRYDSISTNTYYSLKFTYENGTVTSYMGGTQKGQYTGKTYLNGETRNLYWCEWDSGRTVTAKNIKIKPL